MVISYMQNVQESYVSQLSVVISFVPKSALDSRISSIWSSPSFASILAQPPFIPGMEESFGGKLHCSCSLQRGIPSGPMEKRC